MEQEIDLRIYLDILLRWWWLAILLAILFGGVVLAVNMGITPEYEAKAGLLYLPTRAIISLGSEFVSSTGGDLPTNTASSVVMDSQQRRYASLTNLVKNFDIAQQVVENMGDDLPIEDASPSALLAYVHGEVLSTEGGGESDTLQVVVTHPDPVLAAKIANAWAEVYEDYVNRIFSDASYNPFGDINTQVENAQQNYDKAQTELITFMREEDKSAELQRNITEDMGVITRLYEGRQLSYIDIITAQTEAQSALFDYSIVASTNSSLKVFSEHWTDFITDYTRAYARRRMYRNIREDTILMRSQLLDGGEAAAATNALALQTLKSRVANIDAVLWYGEIDVQVDSIEDIFGNIPLGQQLADLESIISSLDAEITRLDTVILDTEAMIFSGEISEFMESLTPESVDATSSASEAALIGMGEWDGLLTYSDILEAPFSTEIIRLEDQVRKNRAELETLSGQSQILQNERDLAWSTYKNLVSKQQEIDLVSAAAGSDVVFAIKAVPSSIPVKPQKVQNTAIATVLGGMIGVVGGFLLDYLQFDSKPKKLWYQLWHKGSRAA